MAIKDTGDCNPVSPVAAPDLCYPKDNKSLISYKNLYDNRNKCEENDPCTIKSDFSFPSAVAAEPGVSSGSYYVGNDLITVKCEDLFYTAAGDLINNLVPTSITVEKDKFKVGLKIPFEQKDVNEAKQKANQQANDYAKASIICQFGSNEFSLVCPQTYVDEDVEKPANLIGIDSNNPFGPSVFYDKNYLTQRVQYSENIIHDDIVSVVDGLNAQIKDLAYSSISCSYGNFYLEKKCALNAVNEGDYKNNYIVEKDTYIIKAGISLPDSNHPDYYINVKEAQEESDSLADNFAKSAIQCVFLNKQIIHACPEKSFLSVPTSNYQAYSADVNVLTLINNQTMEDLTDLSQETIYSLEAEEGFSIKCFRIQRGAFIQIATGDNFEDDYQEEVDLQASNYVKASISCNYYNNRLNLNCDLGRILNSEEYSHESSAYKILSNIDKATDEETDETQREINTFDLNALSSYQDIDVYSFGNSNSEGWWDEKVASYNNVWFWRNNYLLQKGAVYEVDQGYITYEETAYPIILYSNKATATAFLGSDEVSVIQGTTDNERTTFTYENGEEQAQINFTQYDLAYIEIDGIIYYLEFDSNAATIQRSEIIDSNTVVNQVILYGTVNTRVSEFTTYAEYDRMTVEDQEEESGWITKTRLAVKKSSIPSFEIKPGMFQEKAYWYTSYPQEDSNGDITINYIKNTEFENYEKVNQEARMTLKASVSCIYGNLYFPPLDCSGDVYTPGAICNGKSCEEDNINGCGYTVTSDEIAANYMVSEMPDKADYLAQTLREAQRVCLRCDIIGGGGGGGGIKTVSVNVSGTASCTCKTYCCFI